MGCDRNLFTLRLVLNQTQGEWQWQAAAEGWRGAVGEAGGAQKAAWIRHVAPVHHYNHPLLVGGSSPRGWRDGKDGEMERARDVQNEQTMSDVPTTRQPVPRPGWNDYQVAQRATMNHPSSILQNAPSLSQTASQPASQSIRKEADSHRLGQRSLQTAGKNGSYSKHKAPSKLALSEKLCAG